MRELYLDFQHDEDSLLAIVREEHGKPTIIGMISNMSIQSDKILEVEFKGIMLAHVRRVVNQQGYDIGEIKTTERKTDAGPETHS